ncbi:hypothetical protein GUJ93_ZPchr0008g11561 [Zizania palustris]|uniref:Uncharacterized protein n=1 Tax=Zizania palustris TaxID=103762 RepID=A0A8J5S0F2_ZIZPA|nr:hypothetical protein GUJ93_ZPchr0008g11561 [Zizania palustris]
MEGLEAKLAAEMVGDGFTEADLEAADNLVQLSFSGGGEEDDDRAEDSSSSRSSTLSVNKAAEAVAAGEHQHADGDDDDETGLDRRVRKRYRLLAELYVATLPVKDGGRKRKKSERMGLPPRKL